MRLLWSDEAWEEYLYWQQTDQKVLQAINDLIKDIRRDPFKGLAVCRT
jgi:toxin YoeB